MPATKARNRSLPVNALNNAAQQVNGFYVHSSPPKALQVNPRAIRQWIRSGDLDKLEKLVLDGQGHKLVGEFSSDSKVRNFLKQVPSYLTKVMELHKAVAKGDLQQLKRLLETKGSDLKNIAMCKNHAGVGLLHKAVYHGYVDIVQFLISNFPQMLNAKDKEGKTPLHYCGASERAGRIWPVLLKAGGDQMITDSRNKLPFYYMERSNEIEMTEDIAMPEVSAPSAPPDLVIKPSNIRIWIHDRDLGKLQQVIWEGHGGKLRVETSNNVRVRRFLEGVPHILNVIKDVHFAVVHDDYADFMKKSSDPVPVEILGSKDMNGLNPLHKAAGLGRRTIAQNILERNQKLVQSVDHEGRTPLHYAAALRDNNAMYNFLKAKNADETALDKNGKAPSYYRTNPKELNPKILEAIPEAPRTAQQFPQTWDWMLFYPGGSAPSTLASLPRTNEVETPKQTELEQLEEAGPPVEPPVEPTGEDPNREPQKQKSEEDAKPKEEDEQSEVDAKPAENVEGVKEEKVPEPVEEETQVEKEQIEAESNEDYDIWTNEDANHADEDKEDKGSTEDEGYPKEEDSGVKDQNESDSDKQDEEGFLGDQTPGNRSVDSLNDSGLNESSENREKTEREIAEERQRLLDEGLLKINSVDNEMNEEDKLNGIIESGDMEKLAFMVLNGEGEKLLEKTSKNAEVQTFLDNLPTYMAKIRAVHKAAKSGSLKDLQGALDRRRFAIAKESGDNLGATPLHVALLFQNSQIVKYLGGRFPETLNVKDKFGRTPLHYAAVLPDNNYFYSTLLNLGADQNIKDNEGHTPEYYQENPGVLTKEKLLEELDARDVSSPLTDPSVHNTEPQISFDEGIPLSKTTGSEDKDDGSDSPPSNFSTTDRDEYGQSILHFASARGHGRGGLFQLIQESSVNLGYRDELYRTARDIALQANIPENVNEIDRFIMSLAARGEKDKLIQLYLEGYDHILDMEDDEGNDILTVAENKNNEKTVTFLKAIPIFEEKRERVHRAIRAGEEKLVQDIIADSKNGRLIVIGKNSTGRCSLHISVLCQQKEITEFIAQKFPETLKIGDNLERTALHYSMGVEEVETLSKILIQCGAKRVVKDLKGRQPTYYFMNRTEILKLQEEENILKA